MREEPPLTKWKRLGGHLSTAPAALAGSKNHVEVYAGGPDHFVWVTSSPEWAWTSPGGRRTYSAPAFGFVPQTNGGWLLIRGTDNTLWGKGPHLGAKWQRIGSKLITGAPTAAGTRQPTARVIAVVRDTDRAPWTTLNLAAGGGWSAFTRPWIPQG